MITRDAPVLLHVVDFNLTAPNPNSLSVGAGRNVDYQYVRSDGGGKFCGDGGIDLFGGVAVRRGLLVFAHEFGESYVFESCDDYIDADGSSWDSGGNFACDNFGDDGGSSGG